MSTAVERIVINEIDQSQGKIVLDDVYNVLLISEKITEFDPTLYTDIETFKEKYPTITDEIVTKSLADFASLGLGVYVSNASNCTKFKDMYRYDVLFIYDTRQLPTDDEVGTFFEKINSLIGARLDCLYLPADFNDKKVDFDAFFTKVKSGVTKTSCGALYSPGVKLGGGTVFPGSYAFIRNFASSISAGNPAWFAIAGINRGLLSYVSDTSRVIDDDEALSSQEKAQSNYNPIINLSNTYGNVLWGQRTLQAENTALKSVNVRILSCMIKKRIFNISLNLLFEMNDLALWNQFRGLLTPYLDQIKYGQGLHDYEIIMDQASQDTVDEMTVKGYVRIQPTRSAEYFDIDFILTGQSSSSEEE